MTPKLIWLSVFVGLYWAYCLYWGFKGAQRSRTSADYFVAGRSIGLWVFVLAATATSFSGWTFIGHPGKIFSDGLPYAFASFYALTIPFTGVLFLRRQWILGRAFRYITPGEMYSDYYGGHAMRLLTVLVAFLFSVPYLGVQLRASGDLFHVLTDGLVPVEIGMFALSAVVMIYVAAGGLRSVAYVDCVQCVLLAIGIVILGYISIHFCGGWSEFTEGVGELVKNDLAAPRGRKEPHIGWIFKLCCPARTGSKCVQGCGCGRWYVDGNDVSDVHVCFDGHPILSRFFDVDLCKPDQQALPLAAGGGLFNRDWNHSFYLYNLPGIGRARFD